MSRTEIKRSKFAMGFVIVTGFFIVGIGSLMLNDGGVLGWCLIPTGITFLVAGALGVWDNKPRVTISVDGIGARGLVEEIPWQRIHSARLEKIPGSGTFVVLEMKNQENQRFSVEGLQFSEEAILTMVRKHISEDT